MTLLKETPNTLRIGLPRLVSVAITATDPDVAWPIPSSDRDVTGRENWTHGYSRPTKTHITATNSTENLRRRLDNVNNHFRRKASEVFNDEAALMLLAEMYEKIIVQIADFDPGKNGIPLAKLTAANFCEIGENVIYITADGQKFIQSIDAYG